MKLPLPSLFGKKEVKEYYLALLFRDEQIQAVVFEETNGTLRIYNDAVELIPGSLDGLPFEKLLTILDKVISTAESSLPHGVQTHKTIFGVKETWVQDAQIKKEYLETLKKACQELDLQPIGFLVFPEAIAHLLQKEEGAPVSGILIELGKMSINATLFRGGRIVQSRQGPIQQDDLPTSVDNLLKFFVDVEILPSRIILFDGTNTTKLTQQFIHHHWSKTLPFLHVPQVTPLAAGFDTRAILHGTATQMNFTVVESGPRTRVAQSLSQQMAEEEAEKPEEKELVQEELASKPTQKEEQEETEEAEETTPPTEELPQQPVEEDSAENFGFVKNVDVGKNAPEKPHIVSDSIHMKDNFFDESEDTLAEETFAEIPEHVKEEEEGEGTPDGFGVQAVAMSEGLKKIGSQVLKRFHTKGFNIPEGFKTFPSFLGAVSLPPMKMNVLLIIPLVLILLFTGLIWYIFGVNAAVTLHLNPQTINQNTSITISSTASTDSSQHTLSGSVVTVSESGSTTTDATGTKETGTPAKGTITIYNNNDSSKSFSQGDTFTSSNGLKFTLDNDVTVASASGDIFSGTKPGTKDVSVTASTFGTEYNLPSGTTFSSGSSSVAGKNSSAFSGGTKKSITVVSANDISKAIDDLTNKLKDKAKQDLLSQNNGKNLLPDFTSTTITKKSTDKNAGDEAQSVTLTGTISYQSMVYSSDDIKSLAQDSLKDKLTGDMALSSQGVVGQLSDIAPSKDGKSSQATLKASANLIPKIDTTSVAKEIAGKPFSQLKNTLSSISQLDSVDVVLSPNLFFLPRILPRLSSHISVRVVANE
ncbi:MAG TPA: hypothetical protein VFQ63_03890 [Patescibacteria group bacterium]|nr:hypothetical protein [Patescibacteria group bacterium]